MTNEFMANLSFLQIVLISVILFLAGIGLIRMGLDLYYFMNLASGDAEYTEEHDQILDNENWLLPVKVVDKNDKG